MNAIRYIFLSICALFEVLMLLFGLEGIRLFYGDPSPKVPMSMVYTVTVCAIVLLVITVSGFRKVRKKKEYPVLLGFLMKIPVCILALGVIWFGLDIPEAGALAVGIAVLLGGLILFLHRPSAGKKKAQQKYILPEFKVDKAEWAWDDAAAEYLRLSGKDSITLAEYAKNISDEENDRIYDYAGTPIAYFLGWLIRNDLVSEEFKKVHSPESLQQVRDEITTPVEIFRNMDYVLAKEDLKPEAQQFADRYYTTGGISGVYNHNVQKYFFDYYRVICSGFDVPRYYCVDFTWSSFHELTAVLDQRYRAFNHYGLEEENLETDGRKLRAPYFDKEAELRWEKGTPREYVELCADAYENMGGTLCRDMSENLIEYCQEELLEEDMLPEKVIWEFEPAEVIVLQPEDSGSVPAYVVRGESEWEPEHGIAFTVIGDYVVSSTYYADAESPWEDDQQWKYRIRRDAECGNYSAANVIPTQFGGSSAADNQIVIPAAATKRKEEYDMRVEALFMLGLADSYDCRLTYDKDKPNYLFVSATKGKVRTYADSMPLR